MSYLQMQQIQSQNEHNYVQTESNVSTCKFEIQILHFLRVDQWHNLMWLEWSVPK